MTREPADRALGATNGKGMDYRVYGKGFIRSHEFNPDGPHFDEWRMGQLGFRTDWTRNARDTLNVQGDMYKGRDGERVDASYYSPPSVTLISAPPNSTSGGNMMAGWRRQISEQFRH